jgi:hypothetical protein
MTTLTPAPGVNRPPDEDVRRRLDTLDIRKEDGSHAPTSHSKKFKVIPKNHKEQWPSPKSLKDATQHARKEQVQKHFNSINNSVEI